jgi:ABC-type lipoprotein export system ATPase subunit
MSNIVLQMTGVSKAYRARAGAQHVHALSGVDFALRQGEFVGLHGPSGCGKSTLLLVAGALLRPDEGNVQIDGQDPYQLNPSARAGFRSRHLGFVFQRFHLVPYLTVFENTVISELAGRDKALRERAADVLHQLGLTHRLRHRPSELSVGEQQRVALARAVCGGASILLADEPTGNLDAENGRTVLAFLADFAQDGGTVLMVTHEQRAADYAFRHINMRDGRLEKEKQ